jgi:hypothetical protein
MRSTGMSGFIVMPKRMRSPVLNLGAFVLTGFEILLSRAKAN